jgi:hypothetical protein
MKQGITHKPDVEELTRAIGQGSSSMHPVHAAILRTLLYYDIWHFPLTLEELYAFLPLEVNTLGNFRCFLEEHGPGPMVGEQNGYYFIRASGEMVVALRKRRENHARFMWRMARVSTHILKRCPFVRAVFVSGELSKNATQRNSDVDFVIITVPGRLWIARTLMILFKKTVLLNRKKFFCVNYHVSQQHFTLDERNVYVATEVAHMKPLYNSSVFSEYLRANDWIGSFFPNFDVRFLPRIPFNDRPSSLQRLMERTLSLLPLDRIDSRLQEWMKNVWARRYPDIDPHLRDEIFRSTRNESRAYVGNFQKNILDLYEQKLSRFGFPPDGYRD